jgi:hypothetical protein
VRQRLTTHQVRADDLVLPSGSIVAWDAFVVFGARSFDRTVAPGQYPVMLTITQDDTGDKRVAFARIEVAQGTPVRWEMATLPGQDTAALDADHFFGYSVDSGTGSFMDAQTAALATQDYASYGEPLLTLLSTAVTNDLYWTSIVVDAADGANAVAFTAGYGDGEYASYWGFDDHDQVVCLVTNFGVLDAATRVP